MDKSSTKTYQKGTATAAFLILIAVFYTIIFHKFYLTYEYLPSHDYNVAFPSAHIVTNYLINGHLPLWTPEQNSGSPVWSDAEVFPGCDPISLIVNFIYAFAGSSSVYSHVMTIFIWHLIFAAGVFLLFRRLGLSRWASIFGFTITLFSTLTALNFRQADDYVTVYRYIPLLFYSIIKFFQEATFKNSILVGLILGICTAGYQTPNIILLLIVIFFASIPLLKKSSLKTCLKMLPAFVITTLMWSPLIVASIFWVTNKAVARELFPYGYRGDIADIFGPISRIYPDETAIYIGFIPFIFAILGLWNFIKRQFCNPTDKYWPNSFVLVFGMLVWIIYIGFLERFIGLDNHFFFIRSFNNMYPFIILVLCYFSCMYINEVDYGFYNSKFKKNLTDVFLNRPLPFLIIAVIGITIFVELSRPSIITVGFNRYSQGGLRPGVPLVIENFIIHNSFGHIGIYLIISILICILSIAMVKRYKSFVFICIILLTIIDLTIVNSLLLTRYCAFATSHPRLKQILDTKPILRAPMVESLPISRKRNFEPKSYWHKQGNVLYHEFSSAASIGVTWFQTRLFYDFVNSIESYERFDFLTGVTRPIIYFANKVILKDGKEIFSVLNGLPIEDLKGSIVVDRNEFPANGQIELPFPHSATFEILDYGPNHIKLKTTADTSVYLVYLDSYSKDWFAYLDGRTLPIIRANYLFKSVLVPQGKHILDFKYKPYSYIFAFYARSIGFLGAILLLLKRR